MQSIIASTENAERYNDGVAQRASLKDHYSKHIVSKGVVKKDFVIAGENVQEGITTTVETYHGLTQRIKKLTHRLD
jgi:histidinol-phosphate/aromatic aminotransferase/cobyric acid decarboxylase-like protein